MQDTENLSLPLTLHNWPKMPDNVTPLLYVEVTGSVATSPLMGCLSIAG